MSEPLRPDEPLSVATPGTDQVHEPGTEQGHEPNAQQSPKPDSEQPLEPAEPQEPGGDQHNPPGADQPQKPADHGRQHKDKGSGRNRRRPAGPKPFTVEQILTELDDLTGAVAAGWIKPATANAMSRIYQMKLACLRLGDAQQASGGVPSEILADLARRDQHAFNILVPFLTDEQVDEIVGNNLSEDDLSDDTPEEDEADPPA